MLIHVFEVRMHCLRVCGEKKCHKFTQVLDVFEFWGETITLCCSESADLVCSRLSENQRVMQLGRNHCSGAAALAALQRTFERVFRARGLFLHPIFASQTRSLCISASRCQGWHVFIKHISFLFYPSVSLANTAAPLPGGFFFFLPLSDERSWIFLQFSSAKTLMIKDAHIN